MFREKLFEFPEAVRSDPAVEDWFKARGELGMIARRWFDVMRGQGDDVRELLHDLHPTACVGDVAFGYVNAFTTHVNVGFFQGTELPDPHRLLEGTGKFMRHVKIQPGDPIDEQALTKLIEAAYTDVKHREREMTIKAIAPQLRTTDMASSIAFYTEKLGFELAFRFEDFYAGIKAGGQTFHLKYVCDPDPSIPFVDEGGHLHLYFETDDVAAVAERLKSNGVALVKDVHETDWQTREIVLNDDQGHTLYFGQPL